MTAAQQCMKPKYFDFAGTNLHRSSMLWGHTACTQDFCQPSQLTSGLTTKNLNRDKIISWCNLLLDFTDVIGQNGSKSDHKLSHLMGVVTCFTGTSFTV